MNKFTVAANIAFFLLEKTGSVLGQWSGNLTAKEQREMFGEFIGKGKLMIDGAKETVEHTVKVCFGLDFETTFYTTFAGWDTRIARHIEMKAEVVARRKAHDARKAAQFN